MRNKHRELWGAPIRRQRMCIRLNKDEANQRVTLGIESTKGFKEADVNENKIFRGKEKNHQSTATVGEARAEEIRGAADEIKSETNSDELRRENNELAQKSPRPEKLSLFASEAKNSSEGEICEKKRALETSDSGKDPIKRDEEKSTNKRKRGQHEGKRVDDVCKKVKIERGKKNIKQESVERLKHLQKGEKISEI